MELSDLLFTLQWWATFFVVGTAFFPFSLLLFPKFFDKGYIFAKVIGSLIFSYTVFLLGLLHISLNSQLHLVGYFVVLTIVFNGIFLQLKKNFMKETLSVIKSSWGIILFEECLFFLSLLFWAYIRAHQPDIHGLEKFMDFGFVNAILRADSFPPKDMWLAPYVINYYYFGHLLTAVLTKLSGVPSAISYNLMIATLFAYTITCAFSIGGNLLHFFSLLATWREKARRINLHILLGGLLTGFVVTFSGNLHTIYSFFTPYPNEQPVPLWQLAFSANFPNSYWYPNATRFIPFTIHEFPLYSFVVSDLHGHVLGIPIVLTVVAVLLSFFIQKTEQISGKKVLFLSFLLASAYMTSAWDGLIYMLLSFGILLLISPTLSLTKNFQKPRDLIAARELFARFGGVFYYGTLLLGGFIFFSLPFSAFFKPFVSAIGVICAPDFLVAIGKFGPFLFEPDHCQRSVWWQLLTLYGFLYFFVVSFLFFLISVKKTGAKNWNIANGGVFKYFQFEMKNVYRTDLFVLLLILLSTLLILIPEFIYLKDIYPAHYRANTMFKLAYQAFMLLSISSIYIFFRILLTVDRKKIKTFLFYGVSVFLIGLVLLYPNFAIGSYYGDLKTYRGLDGTTYLSSLYPSDYKAILWLQANMPGQPVILEAQGDSYTDFGRVSANTGLPTVLGWTVHEWLWRGNYDLPAGRVDEVKKMYESTNIDETKSLFKKYNVTLIFVGELERQKYPNLNEDAFKELGTAVYHNGATTIYKIN